MQYKCKITVIDKKCFSDLQEKYLADPRSGSCPFYNVGDEFVFERYGDEDTFWREGNGTQCAEAWDCISRYVYTALQGGSIMRHWTNDEHMMIACCNDGTRPVIFKIERQDYLVVNTSGGSVDESEAVSRLLSLPNVSRAEYRKDKGWFEVFADRNAPADEKEIAKIFERLGADWVSIE